MGREKGNYHELGHVPPIQLHSDFARFNWVRRPYDRVEVVVGDSVQPQARHMPAWYEESTPPTSAKSKIFSLAGKTQPFEPSSMVNAKSGRRYCSRSVENLVSPWDGYSQAKARQTLFRTFSVPPSGNRRCQKISLPSSVRLADYFVIA